MVKLQTKEGGYRVADESLEKLEDLLLHCWNLEREQIKRTIDFNREQGIKVPDGYIGYGYAEGTSSPMEVKQRKRWLAQVRNKRSDQYLTLDSLLAAGTISDSEKEIFQGQQFPRVELICVTRVKTHDGSEFLMRILRAVGLNSIGGVYRVTINGDCDYTHRVPITPETVNQDGVEIKMLTVGSCENSYGQLPRIWTTPFNRDNVMATLQKYQPYTEDNGTQGNIQYSLMKEGTTRTIGVSSLEEFIDGDFMEIWERNSQPAPQINISSKDLATYVKLDRESREKGNQYG